MEGWFQRRAKPQTKHLTVDINAYWLSGSIVDAAHFHRFADSRNNDPRTGLALCKNAHWLFDTDLWTLDDDYRVRVAATKFSESGAEGLRLKTLEGQRIRLPVASQYWPDPVHMAWHRNNRFQGV